MKFGEKVRDLRKKHSLTQDELAQCLGINKRTIIGWERDGRYPRSIEMLEKMADIFHVPLTYLQPDHNEEETDPVDDAKSSDSHVASVVFQAVIDEDDHHAGTKVHQEGR